MQSEIQGSMTRRGWLAISAGSVGAAVLAACGAEQAAPRTSAEPTPGLAAPAQVSIPGSGIVTAAYQGEAKNLTGAGATFPAALYSKWFTEYNRVTGVQVNYQSIGSSGGIKAISDQTADFGATDAPLTDQQATEAKGGELLHI